MSMNQLVVAREPVRRRVRAFPAAPTDRGLLLCEITWRQLECLAWVEEGKSASDIGGILGISQRTVEGHLLKICGHLGVRTRFQALMKAREIGLLPLQAVNLLARSK